MASASLSRPEEAAVAALVLLAKSKIKLIRKASMLRKNLSGFGEREVWFLMRRRQRERVVCVCV